MRELLGLLSHNLLQVHRPAASALRYYSGRSEAR